MPTPEKLTHCTLTGVDERTDLQKVADLSTRFPIAEWGFLYSPKRQGQPGRYPSTATLRRAFRELPSHVRVAMHVCGQGVHDLLADEPVVTELMSLVKARGGRIQLNFNQQREPIDLDALRTLLAKHPTLTVITQQNSANETVWKDLGRATNHVVLFDSSGGRGILADAWPDLIDGVRCGYAGGLGPDNLITQLRNIAVATRGHSTWVDMEGSLRVPDSTGAEWLELARCEACLEIASAAVTGLPGHI